MGWLWLTSRCTLCFSALAPLSPWGLLDQLHHHLACPHPGDLGSVTTGERPCSLPYSLVPGYVHGGSCEPQLPPPLEISHPFSCSHPATSSRMVQHLVVGTCPCGNCLACPTELDTTILWTEELCNYLVRDLGVLQEGRRGRCGHGGQLVLLPFLSRLSVFTGLFPQIFGKYTGSRGECYQAPAALFASVSSAGMVNPPLFSAFPSKSP